MTEKLTFEWAKGQGGVLWLVQPRADALRGGPPFIPVPEQCAWNVLKYAFEIDAKEKEKGPVVFVAPELSLHPDRVQDVVDAIKALPDNRLVIAGLGHLTRDQCEKLEQNTGARDAFWNGPWAPGAFANVALVATKHEVFIQPKGQPSHDERAAGCFIGGSQLRVFEADSGGGASVRFVVTICSEWLDDADPDGFARRAAEARPDVVFWLQHNRKPRSEKFQSRLLSLFESGRPLIVTANCSPKKDRLEYGASGLLLTDLHVLPPSKHILCKSADYCTEAVVPGRFVARVALPRYDVDAHRIYTILPRDLAAYGDTDAARSRFVSAVYPYVVRDAALEIDARPGNHISQLLELGAANARARSGLAEEDVAALKAAAGAIEEDLRKPNRLSVFLDLALVQADDPKHLNYEDHPEAASCCCCWEHRINSDTLFDEAKEMPGKIAELVLALAALGGRVSVDRKRREYSNADVAGSPVLVAVHAGSEDSFEKAYFRGQIVLRPRPTVVLRAGPGRRIGRVDAARLTPRGAIDQANAHLPEPVRLCGDEFWRAIAARTALADLGIGTGP